MRRLLILCAVVQLVACTSAPPVPHTITITKTQPVFPPAQLYGLNDGCAHGPVRASGTVQDLANALIDERAAVDVCLSDRAALRGWRATNEAK